MRSPPQPKRPTHIPGYDVYAVCQAELATPQTCWQLWQQRQELMGNEPDRERAFLDLA